MCYIKTTARYLLNSLHFLFNAYNTSGISIPILICKQCKEPFLFRFDLRDHKQIQHGDFLCLELFREIHGVQCIFAHLSLPWSIGWVALSFLLFVRLSRYGDIRPNLTSRCPTPPNPYIFWKLMIIAIQKWIKNTNTKTKTNTKTMTKTKTPRE